MKGIEDEYTHRYSPHSWLKGITTIIKMSIPIKGALRFMKSLVKMTFSFFFLNDNFYRNNPIISWTW